MIESAQHLPLYPLPEDWEERPKVTGFALDPHYAEDHDDAVHVEITADGNLKIQVHIADPWAYLNPEDPIVQTAIERGKSKFGGEKEASQHMLDEAHANFFSLNCVENEYKASITFECVMTAKGQLIGEVQIYKSKVHSQFVPIIENEVENAPDELDLDLIHQAGNALAKNKKRKISAESGNLRDAIGEFNGFANRVAAACLQESTHKPLINFGRNYAHISAPIRSSKDLYNLFLLHKRLTENPDEFQIDRLRQIFREKAAKARHQIRLNKLTHNPKELDERDIIACGRDLHQLFKEDANAINADHIDTLLNLSMTISNCLIPPNAPKLLTLAKYYVPNHKIISLMLNELGTNPKEATQFANQLKQYTKDFPKNTQGKYTNNTGIKYKHIRALGQIMEWLYGPPSSQRILFIGNWHMMDNHPANLIGQNRLKLHKKCRQSDHRYELCFTNEAETCVAGMQSTADIPQSVHSQLGMEMLKQRCIHDMKTLWPNAPENLPFMALDEGQIEFLKED